MINRIYRHARENPESLAVVNSGEEICYRRFANSIEAVRNFLMRARLPHDGIIVNIRSNLYHDWVLLLALRSLGLTTVSGKSWKAIEDLDLRNVAGMVCYSDHAEAIEACTSARPDWPIVQIRRALTAGLGNSTPPPIADCPFGDHILYTSGTTGTSKKLRFDGQLLAYGIENDDTGPSSTVSGADICHAHSFGPWTKAGYMMPLRCWYRGAAVIFDQRADWPQHFFDHAVTKATLVPPFLEQLCQSAASRPRNKSPLGIVIGGAFVHVELAMRAVRELGCDLFVSYGGTEFRTAFASLVTSEEDVVWLKRAFDPGIEIVDEDDRPVSIGEEGILRIQLAPSNPTEYMGDAEATAKHFRNGYFYPGDMAVEREDGRIRILGRVENVLNLGGEKMPTEPFEDWARKVLRVENLCVFNYQDDDGKEIVMVVIEGDRFPERSRLQAMERRVRQMPQARFAITDIRFATINKFPRGENGMMKVNRRKLLEMVRESESQKGVGGTA